jgi:hypothetical protein
LQILELAIPSLHLSYLVLLICSTFEEWLCRLERIFIRLKEANLKLKPTKCYFFQKHVRFLRHIVSEDGISTEPDKINAVKEWPAPKSAKQVRSILGLCSYYRRFVKGFMVCPGVGKQVLVYLSRKFLVHQRHFGIHLSI